MNVPKSLKFKDSKGWVFIEIGRASKSLRSGSLDDENDLSFILDISCFKIWALVFNFGGIYIVALLIDFSEQIKIWSRHLVLLQSVSNFNHCTPLMFIVIVDSVYAKTFQSGHFFSVRIVSLHRSLRFLELCNKVLTAKLVRNVVFWFKKYFASTLYEISNVVFTTQKSIMYKGHFHVNAIIFILKVLAAFGSAKCCWFEQNNF